MKFYIVTPTYNALGWLRCAVRSVADQAGEGIEVHHHVQDGVSSDGTQAWLEEWKKEHQDAPGYTFTYESCSDKGMYDALNHAWDKMPEDAEIAAHLNSDEQYLPGALKAVSLIFGKRENKDMLVTTFLVLREDGSYHCHYRPVQPTAWVCRAVSAIRTSACFLRASSFRRAGVRYNTDYKIIADRLFYADYLKTGIRAGVVPELITVTDAMTGSNLAWSDKLAQEEDKYSATLPWSIKLVRGLVWRTNNLLRRIIDLFYPSPREFAVYRADEEQRSKRLIEHPTCRWNLK